MRGAHRARPRRRVGHRRLRVARRRGPCGGRDVSRHLFHHPGRRGTDGAHLLQRPRRLRPGRPGCDARRSRRPDRRRKVRATMTALPARERGAVPSSRHVLVPVALLWLAGIGLRITILAVPPVIPLIHVDLDLSETEVGVLTGLPPLLFALAAVPGSLLIARFGAVSTAVIGLVITAIAGALRGAAPNAAMLFAATVATGLGVAIMHPSMPSLVRQWLPRRIGFGTAVYTNGLLIGEIFPGAVNIPLVLPLVGGSWRLALAVWGLPVLAIALVILALSPRTAPADQPTPADRRWWPDWKNGLLWRLGGMLGTVNAGFF